MNDASEPDIHDPASAEVFDQLRRSVEATTAVEPALADLHDRVGRNRRWVTTGVAAALVLLIAASVLAVAARDGSDGAPAVDATTTTAPQDPRCDLRTTFVYMMPTATDEQIRLVGDEVEAMGQPVEYVDRAATYEEFQRLFEDQPEFLDAVSPDDMLSSFRVRGELSPAQFAEVELMPGVHVVEGPSPCPTDDELPRDGGVTSTSPPEGD